MTLILFLVVFTFLFLNVYTFLTKRDISANKEADSHENALAAVITSVGYLIIILMQGGILFGLILFLQFLFPSFIMSEGGLPLFSFSLSIACIDTGLDLILKPFLRRKFTRFPLLIMEILFFMLIIYLLSSQAFSSVVHLTLYGSILLGIVAGLANVGLDIVTDSKSRT